jgi:F0F1-type ATP synthase assembly protein I
MAGSGAPDDSGAGAGANGESSRARWALLTSLGIMFPVSITLGGAIGYFIDRRLGTLPWFSGIFLVLGIAAAFVNLFRTLAKFEKLDGESEAATSGPSEREESENLPR